MVLCSGLPLLIVVGDMDADGPDAAGAAGGGR